MCVLFFLQLGLEMGAKSVGILGNPVGITAKRDLLLWFTRKWQGMVSLTQTWRGASKVKRVAFWPRSAGCVERSMWRKEKQ